MISVCMAAYNGERYIERQILTIMRNISKTDELIISDDGSTDSTLEIIERLQQTYPSIHVVQGPKKGVIANFENAIQHAKGDFLYLADQDDIWEEDKVKTVQKVFEEHPKCMLVIHDADIIDENESVIEASFFQRRGSKAGLLKNIIKNSYIGCCMAFRTEILNVVLPIPKNIEMHDQWIGIISELQGGAIFLKTVLFHYRRHGENVSSFEHYPVPKMIRNRFVLIVELIKRYLRREKG